jgi:Fur family zinc uptake transcriptional regulator
MAEAAEVCNARGARLTTLRARVLEIVWRSHRPLGAYAILDVLADEGRTPAPPTVYRALDFLTEQGLVHRLASLNAFIGCSQPGHPGTCQFLLCRGCGAVAELDDPAIRRAIQRTAVTEGFEAHEHTVEVSGICPNCQRRAS